MQSLELTKASNTTKHKQNKTNSMLDLNDSTSANTDLSALFSEDLTNIDVSRSILRTGVYQFEVRNCEVRAQKPPKEGQNLSITLSLAVMAQGTKGQEVNPGFAISTQISLTPTEKYTPARIKENLRRFQLACGRNGPFGTADSYIGCRLTARVGIRPENQYGPELNEIKEFVPASS